MDYNLSIKWIAKENGINSESVRKILKRAMINYPKQVKNLPRVISFDEFKADTQYGKRKQVLKMVITRTPFRISLCGGGSDIKSFYEKHGGCVLSTTINKYMYITTHPSFEKKQQFLN